MDQATHSGTAETSERIQVLLSEDRLSAELLLMPLNGEDPPTVDLCCGHLQQRGVQVDDVVRQIVETVLEALPRATKKLRCVVARGRAAVHGEDGRVEWRVGQSLEEDAEGSVNHYERSAFIAVQSGQVLGDVIVPTEGCCGREVTGASLPARAGRPVDLQLDGTVVRDEENRLVAQIDGILHRDGAKVSIREMLEISKNVDFSTGNIDFKGDVIIRGGVEDRFVIKATGGVEVHGVIGAAMITCDGDLRAAGGMAGNEVGQVHVGGSMVARYLNSVAGEVADQLCVERDAMGCDLTVGGVKSPTGTIRGGRVQVTGPVEVATLGSDGSVTTVLAVSSGARLDVKVFKHLYAGVHLLVNGRTYQITDSIRGPVRLTLDGEGNLRFGRP